MKSIFGTFFTGLAAYFVWVIWDSLQTGRFVAKSPKYPALRSEEPIFFWLGLAITAVMVITCLYVAYIMWKNEDQEED